MAYLVYNPDLDEGRAPFRDYSVAYMRHQVDLERGGPMRRQAVELDPVTYRRYRWSAALREDLAQRTAWEAFLDQLGWGRLPFLIRDPRDAVRVQLALEPSVGDGARVEFSLPTVDTVDTYNLYALASSVQLYVNGAPVAHASSDQDARTITAAAPPGIGQSVAATFQPLRLVVVAASQLQAGLELRSTHQHRATYELELEELVRDE